MTEHYFFYPFGINGDLTAIPNPTQISGTVSYQSGFPIGYEEANTNPGYQSVPRNQFNQLMFDVTGAIQQVQQTGFASWITAAANGGTSFSYAAGAQVWYSGQPWYSLVGANTSTPGTDPTKWGAIVYNVQSFLTGDVVETYSNNLPAGWLWLDGLTIGSVASGATSRANADTQNLFTALWNSIPNAALPIQDSTGAATARGVSAAADFSANKRLPVPDKRGKVAACVDQFPGGAAAGILTGNTSQGVNGAIPGNFGGEQSHTLNTGEMPDHNHLMANSDSGSPSGLNSGSHVCQTYINQALSYVLSGTTTTPSLGLTSDAGSSQTHNNVQPTLVAFFRIKL